MTGGRPGMRHSVAWAVPARAGLLVLAIVGGGLMVVPGDPRWIVLLLLFSPLVLMRLGEPLYWARLGLAPPVREAWHVAACAGLVLSFLLPAGLFAAAAAGPWLGLRVALAGHVAGRWRGQVPRDAGVLIADGGMIFPVVGAAWLVAARAGWSPLGFSPLVVLLTAAHFHHAGFSLPLLAGWCAQAGAGGLARVACWLVLAGVPLVAAGITTTHFGVLAWVEPVAVLVLVGGALGVAVAQMRQAGRPEIAARARVLFALSGLSLLVAMLLALAYGLRAWLPGLAPGMPFLWAVHGTLNTLGTGLGGLLAWRLAAGGKEAAG